MRSNNINTILRHLVAAKSYYPFENGSHEYLEKFLQMRGFKTLRQKVAKGRYNLLAEKGNAKEAILIFVHIDTVPPVTDWRSNPLRLREENNNYVGLGAFDMKGGTAALLSVLDKISLESYSLRFAFCIDEEGISEGVYTLINSSFISNVVLGLCPEACLVPQNWELPLMITIGGRGRTVIQVKIPGETRHGAENEGGVNAVSQAAIVVQALESFPIKANKYFGKGAFFMRSIHGENDSLSLPDKVMLEIDYQLIPGETPDNVAKQFEQFISGLYKRSILNKKVQSKFSVNVKGRQTPYMLAYQIPQSNPYVRLIRNTLLEQFGNVQFEYTKSVADQNALVSAGIPTITIGPLGGNAHQAEEWVSKTSLEVVADFYQRIFKELDINKHLLRKIK